MIEETEKVDCIDALIFGLNRSAMWRRKMATKYPADPRNARATDCLSRLAIEANTLSDDDWQALKPHAGWASERFREAISQTARTVKFQNKITNLGSFVKHLVDALSQPQSNAA